MAFPGSNLSHFFRPVLAMGAAALALVATTRCIDGATPVCTGDAGCGPGIEAGPEAGPDTGAHADGGDASPPDGQASDAGADAGTDSGTPADTGVGTDATSTDAATG